MTRARTSVKSSAKAQKLKSKWDSPEPYRDGLTYRQWMQRNGKAQRDRELAVLRAARGDGSTVTDSAADPAGDQGTHSPVRTDGPSTEVTASAPAAESVTAEPPSKPRHRAWGRRGWKTAKT